LPRWLPRERVRDDAMTDHGVANLVDDDAGLARILRETRTVAVLGAKAHPSQPAHYVPAYLVRVGYRVLPVNPTLVGTRILGEPVVATLADLAAPVDVVEVFRRPEYLPGHAAEILTLPWRPAVVWFQLGIRNDVAAGRLARAGIRVVQDRCMMPEHRRLLAAGSRQGDG
jgi:predicted CoA-binding protein